MVSKMFTWAVRTFEIRLENQEHQTIEEKKNCGSQTQYNRIGEKLGKWISLKTLSTVYHYLLRITNRFWNLSLLVIWKTGSKWMLKLFCATQVWRTSVRKWHSQRKLTEKFIS